MSALTDAARRKRDNRLSDPASTNAQCYDAEANLAANVYEDLYGDGWQPYYAEWKRDNPQRSYRRPAVQRATS